MFQAEDSLLALTTTKLTDGLFYCLAIKVSDAIVVRYLEFGAFSGYFCAVFLDKLKMLHSDIVFLPVQVYTPTDIDDEKSRNSTLFATRKKEGKNPYLC